MRKPNDMGASPQQMSQTSPRLATDSFFTHIAWDEPARQRLTPCGRKRLAPVLAVASALANTHMQFKPALLLAATLLAANAHADTVAQWNFNANPDTTTIEDTLKASISNGGARLSVVGLTGTPTFPSQTGSSDPGVAASGVGTLSTAGYGACANLSCGVQFAVDTTGYENIFFSFDQKNSGTGSGYTALLYTLDGDNWLQATTFQSTTTDWYNGRSFDFSGIAGASNNESFAVQLVAMYAPGTSAYVGTTSAFGNNGTIRYDMVTFSGAELVSAPVPEPGSVAMLLAGLGCVGVMVRRRSV